MGAATSVNAFPSELSTQKAYKEYVASPVPTKKPREFFVDELDPEVESKPYGTENDSNEDSCHDLVNKEEREAALWIIKVSNSIKLTFQIY